MSAGGTVTELLIRCQQKVVYNLMDQPVVVVAVFTAVLGREGLIYAHFDMTANTSSPVSAAPLHSAEKERKTGERVMAADMLMRTKCQGNGKALGHVRPAAT